MIKDKFKTARNEKQNPKACKMGNESEDNEVFLEFDSKDEVGVFNYCKVIGEDVVGKERTTSKNVI